MVDDEIIPPPPPAPAAPAPIPPPPPYATGPSASPPPPPGYGGDAVWFDPTQGYAGFWTRVGARIIDSLVFGLITLLCLAPAGIVLATGETELEPCRIDRAGDIVIDSDLPDNGVCEVPTSGTIGMAVVAGLVGLVPLIAVQVWYYRREGRTGQTWGRKATGTRLVDAESGRPIGGGRAFGRSLLSGLFSNLLLIGHLWMIWDRRSQTWHDKVITSVVVREPGR